MSLVTSTPTNPKAVSPLRSATALQTLRDCGASSNFAKRLECERFTAAFSTPTGLLLVFSLSQPEEQHCRCYQQRRHPPEPPDAVRLDRFRPEFPFYKFVVVEIFIRQSEMAGIRGFRPAGLLIRAAFGTGPGVARHFCAAVRTDVRRRHGKAERRMMKDENFSRPVQSVPPSAFSLWPSAFVFIPRRRHIPRRFSARAPSKCNRGKWPACP